MGTLRREPLQQRAYVCDACGREIARRQELLLLRVRAALPEEATYHVHRACAARFEAQHAGPRQPLKPTSLDAMQCGS
jgi:hypothetical protein